LSLVLSGKYDERHYSTSSIYEIVFFIIFIHKTIYLRTIRIKVEIEFKNKYPNVKMAQYSSVWKGILSDKEKRTTNK